MSGVKSCERVVIGSHAFWIVDLRHFVFRVFFGSLKSDLGRGLSVIVRRISFSPSRLWVFLL
jgi:hypothetical protein